MKNVMRVGLTLAVLASTPARAAMTKDEPAPTPAAKASSTETRRSDGTRTSGSMLKDDQDEARRSGVGSKVNAPASGGRANAGKAHSGRVSGNMYQQDQDTARASAREKP